MSVYFLMLFQLVAMILVAPLFDGIARKLRAKFQSRVGCQILQSYYDIFKLVKRGRTIPNCSSFIFKFTPFFLFGLICVMFCLLPISYSNYAFGTKFSDILLLIYLGAVFRFVFAIASSDSGSAFAGIGGSRENLVGFYVEPVMIICLGVVMLKTGTTSLLEINFLVKHGIYGYQIPSFAIASIGFLWAMYVEMGRKPYDLAEAEQELGEALVGEYSGRDLALIKFSLIMKQFVMIGFFIVIFEPWSFNNPILSTIMFIIEAGILYILAIFIDNFGPRYKIAKGARISSIFALSIAFVALFLYVIGA